MIDFSRKIMIFYLGGVIRVSLVQFFGLNAWVDWARGLASVVIGRALIGPAQRPSLIHH